MDKRRLAANLLLLAVLFVAVAHTVLALFVFETNLADVGALVALVALGGLALVNF